MGQEFLTDDSPRKSYTEVFYEQLPFYLAIGMSCTEYFDGDCTLTRYFRQAYRIKQEQDDNNAWLNGMYVYKAIDCALYNNPPLMKRGTEPRHYFDKPIMQDNEPVDKSEEAEAIRREQEEAAMGVWLENFVNFYKHTNESA